MSDLIKAKQLLNTGNFTCVLLKGDLFYTSTFRGVKPLVKWQQEKKDFYGYSAADKVVGKATAFLYLLLNVNCLYAKVISKSALNLLTNSNVQVEYDILTENIINRQGDGICPFEKAVLDVTDKFLAYNLILKKMQEMGINIQ